MPDLHLPSSRFVTHEVSNQAPPLQDFNAYSADQALVDAVHREGGGWAESALEAFGALCGGELLELGFVANAHRPQLQLFDRYGHRLDDVEFHPAYHRIMELAIAHGVPSFGWRRADRPGAQVARVALAFLHAQAEQGSGCPLTMSFASVGALRHAPQLEQTWLPRITSDRYDPRPLPVGQKHGALVGMGMTEKQGGSDVRANTTVATAVGDGCYELVGHKWFFSAPTCDAHLVLAQAPEGLSCFLVPRFLDDGCRNRVRIQRLKDKLGDWSNASSEVEFHGALAHPVGQPGRGVATILEMVALTRLDCMMGSAATMRQALQQAIHHTRYRSAFGKPLIEQALMQMVLADLALESEAATALTLRVARAVDAAARDPAEAAFARVATAIGKYWICKRCPPMVNEAQECLGGQGYVEESILARLYRQAPLNSIWEGCGNIQCLDLLRALRREPASVAALIAELRTATGFDRVYDSECATLEALLQQPDFPEAAARWLTERLALALQAAVLIRGGNTMVAAAFCASRLAPDRGGACFGAMPLSIDPVPLIRRAAVDPGI